MDHYSDYPQPKRSRPSDPGSYADQVKPLRNGPTGDDCVDSLLLAPNNASPDHTQVFVDDGSIQPPQTIVSRAYQLEMLDQSLRRNVIVAMDTGTGKTQVAVLRIKTELEKADLSKFVWFLAPTVVLCEQQYNTIRLQMPSVSMKLLTGREKVETWQKQTWTSILEDTLLIVSTPAVLNDALSHAYVSISSLALLVFDEAHNSIGKSGLRKIMTDFYHPAKERLEHVPAILGLTASPSMRSSQKELEELEGTLDAICVTPTSHREQLIQQTNRPRVRRVMYSEISHSHLSTSLHKLLLAYHQMDIRDDPYILKLKENYTERNARKLHKAITKRDTWSQNQLKGLFLRAEALTKELGTWAADRYTWLRVSPLLDRPDQENHFFDADRDAEKLYVARILQAQDWANPTEAPQAEDAVSDKAKLLIAELLKTTGTPVAIIFVKERVVVTMLRDLLLTSRPIRDKYRIATMMGSQSFAGRSRTIYDTFDKSDIGGIHDFTTHKCNLLISTNVSEEGIDVPACNLVICFDKPANSKSFIQRRGRARMRDSELVLFFKQDSESLRDWEDAEAAMKRLYEDEERQRSDLLTLEQSELLGDDVFIVPETRARLDFENAKQHLQHFCNVVAQGDFVDGSPDYIIQQQEGSDEIKALVVLPSVVDPRLRTAQSLRTWKSEKNATKDAAFQSYKALYGAGLLDNHLLPLTAQRGTGIETREPIVDVDQSLQPWRSIAQRWTMPHPRYKYPVRWSEEDGTLLGEYEILLPLEITAPDPIRVYIDDYTRQWISIGPCEIVTEEEAASFPDHTSALLGLHFKHRWPLEEREHVLKIRCCGEELSFTQIGAETFESSREKAMSGDYFIRGRDGRPFTYLGMLERKPLKEDVQEHFWEWDEAPEEEPYVLLQKWTKRADFLHPQPLDQAKPKSSSKPYTCVVPSSWARVDAIPWRHARFGMLIPSIMHELEVMLLVKELSETLLQPVGISNMNLIREAISARSASEPFQYERLEFLGDSILKYCTSIQNSADHLTWPEGYLSLLKDKVVSNSRLSRAAQESRLARFILTKPFTALKWRPLYLFDQLIQPPTEGTQRRLSTKTLADVIEALIGAAYVDGGLSKALKCISVFIPDLDWQDPSLSRQVLLDSYSQTRELAPILAPVQEMIGYEFQTKSLLMEALTHASYNANADQRSLERLEFLGDAILDNVIVTKLHAVQPPLPHYSMHTLKTATVNGDFLAFICLETRYSTTEKFVDEDGEVAQKTVEKSLAAFLRHAAPVLGVEHHETSKRHEQLRDEISAVIQTGSYYPWALLARLQARKFYSDLIEALLGAVWVDSGDLAVCEKVLVTLGIIPYLDRLLRDNVPAMHPKEELGRIALSEKVDYKIETCGDGEGDLRYKCQVFVGDRLVAEVDDGVTKEEVKTRAAKVAFDILTAEQKKDEEMVLH